VLENGVGVSRRATLRSEFVTRRKMEHRETVRPFILTKRSQNVRTAKWRHVWPFFFCDGFVIVLVVVLVLEEMHASSYSNGWDLCDL
jgi:hypothetical protein